ncbi:MAG: hypothetical protein NZM00_05310 [Anaerolinea sp.]|nr:hypothetical protein [Anaerolinea sp.]
MSLNPPRDTLYLSEVRFVIADASAATFPQRLVRALREHGKIADPSAWARDRLPIPRDYAIATSITSGLVVG